MKIYDCFMFFDEEMLLDLRLNIMDQYVDKFVITEANYMHNGSPKKFNFNINNFPKFKNKIIYIPIETPPPGLLTLGPNDDHRTKSNKLIKNAYVREIYQIQKVQDGLIKSDGNDIAIISDLDEIPNLQKINFNKINNKLIFFIQRMYYYKLNLFYESMPWYGSKACKVKNLISPQWLRTIKNKKYPFWRIDTYFSKKKYKNIDFIQDGGWHFTNIMSPENLEKKLLGFLHHVDYESSGLKLEDLKRLMNEKRVMYNHSADKKNQKWGVGKKLQKKDLSEMPNYVLNNINKYKLWLDI